MPRPAHVPFDHMQKCHLHSTSSVGGAFTAHKRSSESENTGYSFVGCKLTGLGAGTSILGRPWGPYSRVVFALSYMSSTVRPQGWDDWGDPMKQRYNDTSDMNLAEKLSGCTSTAE